MKNRLPVSRFTDEQGGAIEHNRRSTDNITREMLKREANNGESTKELVIRYHFENKIEHKAITTTQWWHTKIILGILLAGVAGLIGVIFFAIRSMIIGG